MKSLRTLLVTLMGALTLVACGSGGIQSPDFTPVLKTLSIDNAPGSSTPVGRALQLSSTGGYSMPPGSDPATSPRAASPSYAVDDASVARIDGSMLIGLKVGMVKVTASQDGITSNGVDIEVKPAVLEQIVLSPANPTIPLGSSQVFTATGIYSGDPDPRDIDAADLPLTWASSDVSVATVSPVTGQPTQQRADSTVPASGANPPATTITASTTNTLNEPVAGSTVLTVGPPVFVTITAVSPNPVSVPLGRTQEFIATGNRSDGAVGQTIPDSELIWDSSDVSKATIDSAGIASTLDEGPTTIRARLAADTNLQQTAALTVTQPALDRVVICSDTDADPNTPLVCNVDPANPVSFSTNVAATLQISLTALGIYSDDPTPRAFSQTISCPPTPAPAFPTITWSSNRALDTFSSPTGSTVTFTGSGLAGTAVVTADSSPNELCTETPLSGQVDVVVSIP